MPKQPATDLCGLFVRPNEVLKYQGSNLSFMGQNLASLAKTHGTPIYVYSKKRISQKIEKIKNAFQNNIGIHFAMKSNHNPKILQHIRSRGLGIDVVSGGEINRALECGFKPDQIIFSGVGKSQDEINLGVRKGIFLFNVESPQELERIGQIAGRQNKNVSLSFRINPDVNAQTHPYVTTGFRENKFGMDKSFIPELLRILKRYRKLKLMGLDFHIGSQLTDLKPFEDAVKKSIPLFTSLKNLGHAMTYFNTGGGIGISYKNEKTIDIDRYATQIQKLLKPLNCKILCEPGRFLVGDAGVLLTKVEYLKKTPHRNFIIANTGMHHLLRPALYDSYHHILPIKKSTRTTIVADVVGPICESSDWLAKKIKIPLPQMGDVLAICDVGAYGFVMANEYNLHPKPKEIVI